MNLAQGADPGELLCSVILPRLAAGTIRVLVSDAAEPVLPAGAAEPAAPIAARHAHETHAVCWVLEGRCLLWVAGLTLTLDPQRACIIRPGELHHLRPIRVAEHFRTLWWHLADRGVTVTEVVFTGQRHEGRAVFALPDVPAARLVRSAAQELEANRPYCDLVARAALLELSARVLRALALPRGESGEARSRTGKARVHIRYLVQHVHAHYHQELTLERMASLVGLTPSYFTALFRRYTGRTLMAYIADLRHQEARSLLRNTELSVAAVAEAVGYPDPYYFSRVFKAREGCSPHYYRARFRPATPAEAE